MRRLILASVLAASFGANASTIASDVAFNGFMANVTGANQTSVNFGSNGQATLSTASGNLAASASGTVQVANRPLAVTAAKTASGLKVAGTLIGALVGWPAAGLYAGVALYDIANELGFFVSSGPDGLVVTKPNTEACTVAPCYSYTVNQYPSSTSSTAQGACDKAAVIALGAGAYGVLGNNGTFCSMYRSNGDYFNGYGIYAASVDPVPDVPLDSSITELQNAIANKSGWPSNSHLSAAVAQAVAAGQPSPFVSTDPVTITGPATRVDPATTTTLADGKVKTVTPTQNITYQGDTITVTTVTTTTIYDPVTNTTSTETETKAPEPAPPELETCGLPGKPVCAVKVDETGTEASPELDSQKKIDDGLKNIRDVLADPVSAFPTFPTLNFAFTLPTGCTAVTIPGFAPYLDSIDLCPFVSMFHDIMAIVWVMGGLFGAMSLFFRNALATN